MEPILLRHKIIPDIHKLDVYQKHGGYEAYKKVVTEMQPSEVIDLVKASNLRGRGGAGFPTGIKWSFIPKNAKDVYVVINTDESETGTFKDRELLELNPHQVIEGALIAAYAVGSTRVFNYWRGEYMDAAHACEQAVRDAREAGLLGDNIFGTDYSVEFHNHYGAGAYICGEETALLASLMGEIGQPWSKPPFPAVEGLYAKPTVVNNTETLANVPPIIMKGADWYKSIGTERSPGTKIVCLSGHINKPGNYEIPMGVSYRDILYNEEYGGGIPNGKKFKALLPSGGSGPLMIDEHLDVPMTYEGPETVDSVMGSASLIVMDEETDMVWAALKMIHFFRHESCGKCTPCREGCFWMESLLHRIYEGHGTRKDIDVLNNVAQQMQGKCLCALGEFATSPVLSSIRYFLPEYVAKVNIEQQDAVPVPAD